MRHLELFWEFKTPWVADNLGMGIALGYQGQLS